jgi:hypothetical protein
MTTGASEKGLGSLTRSYQPGIGGSSPRSIWRMRQFFETYRGEAELSPLLRVLPSIPTGLTVSTDCGILC